MSGWTEEELELIATDMPAVKVAEITGRTPDSIRHRRMADRRGIAPRVPSVTDFELDWIADNMHLPCEEQARHLMCGRNRVSRLRKVARSQGYISQRHGKVSRNPNHVGGRILLARTCLKCGLLMDARFYTYRHKNGKSDWSQTCGVCHRGQRPNRKQDKQKQALVSAKRRDFLHQYTIERATRHCQPYVGSDMVVLSDPDKTLLEKAIILGRTYGATMSAVRNYGYTSKHAKWNGDPQDGQWVIRFEEAA